MRRNRRDRGNAVLVSVGIDGFPLLIKLDEKQNIIDWKIVQILLEQRRDIIKEEITKKGRMPRGVTNEQLASSAIPELQLGNMTIDMNMEGNQLQNKDIETALLEFPDHKDDNQTDQGPMQWSLPAWQDDYLNI